MERLTYDFGVGGNHCWQIHGADNELCEDVCKRYSEGCKNCPIGHAFDYLAAYENTGLKPDTVSKLRDIILDISGNIDHLRELVRAEQDGRLVVLPCKVGDTVYKIFGDKIYEMKAVAIPLLISSTGAHLSITSINNRGSCLCLELSDFGKTVFLSHEEAEAALRRFNHG